MGKLEEALEGAGFERLTKVDQICKLILRTDGNEDISCFSPLNITTSQLYYISFYNILIHILFRENT